MQGTDVKRRKWHQTLTLAILPIWNNILTLLQWKGPKISWLILLENKFSLFQIVQWPRLSYNKLNRSGMFATLKIPFPVGVAFFCYIRLHHSHQIHAQWLLWKRGIIFCTMILLPLISRSHVVCHDLALRTSWDKERSFVAKEKVLSCPPQPRMEQKVEQGGHHGVAEWDVESHLSTLY